MKICKFVEGSFIPSMDGASTRFRLVAKHLQKNGIEVVIIHCYRGWSNLRQIQAQSFKTYAIPEKCYYNAEWLLSKIIYKEKPDIIEIDDVESINSVGLKIHRQTKIPIVFDAQFVSSMLLRELGTPFKRIVEKERLERRLKDIISGAICFTELDKLDLFRLTHIPKEKIQVIPLAVDPDEIKPQKINKTSRNILFLANMYYEPNSRAVDLIANVIAPVILKKFPHLKFKFVGDCPKDLKNKYESSSIIFTGRIPDINNVFKDVRLCIAPIKEGGGMRVKVLTYMAVGLPVVSSSVGIAGIDHGGCIKVSDDTNIFIHEMIKLLSSIKLSLKMGRRGRKLIEKEFNWIKVSGKCKLLYEDVVANSLKSSRVPLQIKTRPYWLTETIEKGRFQDKKIGNTKYFILGSDKRRIVAI